MQIAALCTPARAVSLLLLALASACGPANPGAHEPTRSGSVPPAELVHVAADPDGWAAAAWSRCGPLDFDARSACYDALLGAVLREAGVGAAMETLERIGMRDPETNHHGHVLAHHIGIAALTSPERVGAVFAECRPSFQSGCHHGVIQAYFAEFQSADGTGLDAERLNRLCADYRGAQGNRWLLFQCAHGMGHGLVALHDNHLPRALEGCDQLHDEWEREGCYGGAFMENLVGATMPHHAPRPDHAPGHGHAEHAHHGHGREGQREHHEHGQHHEHGENPEHGQHHAHGEHHAHGARATDAFVPLDRADPHYPCSALAERYVYACYSMQTSAVLFWSEGEVQPGIELCESAPEQARTVCFTSLGRDINAYSQGDQDRAIDGCLRVSERYQPNCLIGVAKNRIDVTADPADGIAFCRALASGANRQRCFQAVGEQVAVLEGSTERRAEACRTLEGDDARACRFGAGVPDDVAGRTAPAT